MLRRRQLEVTATPDMQDADQGKEPPGGGKVGFHFAVEPLEQHFRRLVVNPAPGHVDRLDLGGGGLADRLIIRIADREIIADRAAEPAEAEDQRFEFARRLHRRSRSAEPPILHRQPQPVGPVMPGLPGAQRLEAVLLDQIEDRDPAFLLDIGIAPQDRRFVELDMMIRGSAMLAALLANAAWRGKGV